MGIALAAQLQDAFRLLQSGNRVEADRRCAELLRGAPSDPDVLHLAALLARAAGDHPRAQRHIEKAIAASPSRFDLLNTLGLVLSAQGRYADAITALRRATALKPDFADAYNNLGIALEGAQGLQAAGEAYERCLSIRKDHPQAWFNLGRIHRRLKDFGNAEACIRNAMLMQPANAMFIEGLAELELERSRPEAAITILEQGLAKVPGEAGLLNTLSIALCEAGDERRSESVLRELLAIQPDFAPALCNLGAILNRRQPGSREAMSLFRHAISVAPGNQTAPYLLSFCHLSLGELAEGFRLSGWRQMDPGHPAAPAPARGLRKDILAQLQTGGDVVVFSEQGLGDNLFYFRFLQDLPAHRGRLHYAGDLRLAEILESTRIFSQFIGPDKAVPKSALHVLSADLPFHLGMNQCPPPLRLTADPYRVQNWKKKLASVGPAPYVGLTWRAGINFSRVWEKYLFKEIPLEDLASVVSSTAGTVVALQRQPQADEIARLQTAARCPVLDASHANADLADMLALLAALDAQVGVSNTNVHLRAGLGLASDVLVPMPTEWRWSDLAKDSVWFPAARVFRQTADGWETALDNLRRSLEADHASRLSAGRTVS